MKPNRNDSQDSNKMYPDKGGGLLILVVLGLLIIIPFVAAPWIVNAIFG